jgi:hypothetical protein
MDFQASVSLPASGANSGGSWNMNAAGVPISLNSFGASTEDRLVVTNNTGQSSANNSSLSGSFAGAFVGTGIGAAIVGYGVTDATSNSPANWNVVAGVAALTGTPQDAAAEYREGRISDPNGTIGEFIRSYATTDRPAEVTSDVQGRATAFSAPYAPLGSHATYAIGTAQVVQSGSIPRPADLGPLGAAWRPVTRAGQTAQLDPPAQPALRFAGAERPGVPAAWGNRYQT